MGAGRCGAVAAAGRRAEAGGGSVCTERSLAAPAPRGSWGAAHRAQDGAEVHARPRRELLQLRRAHLRAAVELHPLRRRCRRGCCGLDPPPAAPGRRPRQGGGLLLGHPGAGWRTCGRSLPPAQWLQAEHGWPGQDADRLAARGGWELEGAPDLAPRCRHTTAGLSRSSAPPRSPGAKPTMRVSAGPRSPGPAQ